MADLGRTFLVVIFLSAMIAVLLSLFRRCSWGNQSHSINGVASREEHNPVRSQKSPVKGPVVQIAQKTGEIFRSSPDPPSESGRYLSVGSGGSDTLIHYQAKQFLGSAGP